MNWPLAFSASAALAMVASACAPVQQPKQEAPVTSAVSSSVPAPTPGDVAIRINAAQNGQSVAVGGEPAFRGRTRRRADGGLSLGAGAIAGFRHPRRRSQRRHHAARKASPASPAAIIGKCSCSSPPRRGRANWCSNSAAPGKPANRQAMCSASPSWRGSLWTAGASAPRVFRRALKRLPAAGAV